MKHNSRLRSRFPADKDWARFQSKVKAAKDVLDVLLSIIEDEMASKLPKEGDYQASDYVAQRAFRDGQYVQLMMLKRLLESMKG